MGKANNMDRPAFLITVDTEGDNLWSGQGPIETRNSAFLPRFQDLCERHGFKPTYLVNYEMAVDPVFVAFGRDVVGRDRGEMGMHLHAWNSPPLIPLPGEDSAWRPYLIEYPLEIMAAKVAFMTDLLRKTFDVPITSHRAGRWAFNEAYAALLVSHGYHVDCSVTPWVSWRPMPGIPGGRGGTDYSRFPQVAYRINLANISRPGRSPLIELPMTIRPTARQRWLPHVVASRLPARVARRLTGSPTWMRPEGGNRAAMEALAEQTIAAQEPYLQFMLHSSELMPGGSPTFSCPNDIERLYEDLEHLFSTLSGRFRGTTLSEYAASIAGAL